MRKVRDVLLCCDLDGTLVDWDDAFRLWASALAADHDQDVEFVDWMVELGRTGAWQRKELFPLLRDRLGLTAPLQELVASFTDGFSSQFRCVEGGLAALERVKAAGHKVAIVTNGWPSQAAKIRAAGLLELADAVCISAVEGVWKPDPGLLRIAAERADCAIDGGWMIGDSDADIGAAAGAGISSVLVAGNTATIAVELTPTSRADTFAEAVHLVLDDWRTV